MRLQHHSKPYPRHLAGFTLVELMVAMVLGLMLIGAVIQVFISSKQTHIMREQIALLTENGRYATEALQRDIRMAGYSGCRTLDSLEKNKPINIIANSPPSFSDSSDSLQGFEAAAGWTNPTTNTHLAGTDVITINRGTSQGIELKGNMDTTNANIQLNSNPYGIEADDLLLITDCESADLFRASGVSQSAGTITIAHASNANTTNNLSNRYQEDAVVMRFSSNTYFIGANNSNGHSLYLLPVGSTAATELIPNVQDLQIQYSIDTNKDKLADDYVDASAVTDWREVIGVNIGLLQHTSNDVTDEPQDFIFKGEDVNPSNDHLFRTSSWITIGLRNRLK
jgi:type IV pilus assembly protein PilW